MNQNDYIIRPETEKDYRETGLNTGESLRLFSLSGSTLGCGSSVCHFCKKFYNIGNDIPFGTNCQTLIS